MLYCSNSGCPNPFNPDSNKFCQSCGSPTLSTLFRNRYRVIRLLGEGGFGRTYEAIDTDKLDDPCVIKQFFPQVQGTAALEKATALFKQEAKRLYDLGEHPQIPRLIAYFEQDKRLYLVQEFIEGQTLLQELQQQGTFGEEKIKQLLLELLPVLKFVHDRGIIHRDIKPENIMRRRSPLPSLTRGATQSPLFEGGDLMLIDFGVSKQATGTVLGKVGTTVGTPGYAPMEQMRGQVYPASDLYSLGITCIRLITGCFIKEDGTDDIYDGLNGCFIWRKYLPSGVNISAELGKVLDKLIQDYVKARYQSADEVLQSLNSGNDNLGSAVGIDYKKLRDLLASGKWKEADEETRVVMLKAGKREQEGWLDIESINKFPCTDLRTIDQLWVKYSKGRFGFSVQKRIWLEEGGKVDDKTVARLGDRVGWRKDGNWLDWNNLTYSLNARQGHLPMWFGTMLLWGWATWDLRDRASSFAARFLDCNNH